jgi:hypothetical protein
VYSLTSHLDDKRSAAVSLARVPVLASSTEQPRGDLGGFVRYVYSLTSHLDDKRSAAVSLARVPVPASNTEQPRGAIKGFVRCLLFDLSP